VPRDTTESMKQYLALLLLVKRRWVKAQIDALRSELETLHLIGERNSRITRAKGILRVLAQPHTLSIGYLYANELDELGFHNVPFEEERGSDPD
jgi:hypothetical protein